VLNAPGFPFRHNDERPEAVKQGTNIFLTGDDNDRILATAIDVPGTRPGKMAGHVVGWMIAHA